MQKLKKIGSGLLLGSLVFLLFLVVFESVVKIPSWLSVAGRMHPMFLHFPIVLLLLSFFTVWVPVSKSDTEWLDLLRLVSALSAVITAIMGMLLSMEEAAGGKVLQLHKWGGVLIAVLGYLFYSYYQLLLQYKTVTRSFTLLATAAIIATGHWGADLTHGENFVLGPIKKNRPKPVVKPEEAVVFADVILPIFEKKCNSCHNESNLKGELLLETVSGLLKGGKSGPLFIPGQPDTSLIIDRLHRPLDDKKRMPPPNKPQLSEAELSLLYAWVKSGAVTDAKLFTLAETDSFRILATNILEQPVPTKPTPVYDFEAASEKKIVELNNNYRTIIPLGKGSPALAANLFGMNVYNSKSLEELLPLKKQIVELSLSRLPVKDEDLKIVRQMENLRKLNLNYTDVTDKGIEQLNGLKHLQELAVSGTAVTEAAYEAALKLPTLSSLYAWDTKADSIQVNALRKKYPAIYIESGFTSSNDEVVALSAPVIKTPGGLFDKKTELEIRHPFKGVEIRYTLDGSMPDSSTSAVYTSPIPINKNTNLVARAFKPGWLGSNSVRASYIRKGYTPDSIVLVTRPAPNFTPTSEKNLIDGELGNFDNVGNGDWFGYRENEANILLLFNEPIKATSVMAMGNKNIGRYIFPPSSVEVWGGNNPQQLKLLGSIKPTQPKDGGEFSTLLELKIDFPETELKCLRLVAKPVLSLPQWHGGKGERGWVFLSEVVVD